METKIKTVKETNEDESQAVICSWCLQNSLIPVAVPNGFNLGGLSKLLRTYGAGMSELKAQNAKQIAMLKKEGLHTGFPDLLIIAIRNGQGSILFMENKVKGNTPSPIQEACHQWLRNLGFTVEVSKDSIDAIRKIRYFFGDCPQYLNNSYINNRRQLMIEVKNARKS